jgi:ribose-phosphate pyrophosphokinase
MAIWLNEKKVETFLFSGGECHVKIVPSDIQTTTTIVSSPNNSDDIMCLLLTVDAVRRVNPQTNIHLTIPYFPYARQDRVCNEGEALSVKVMAGLINGLNCSKVTIVDPHSDVTTALLNNVVTISLADIVAQSVVAKIIQEKNLTLLSPDAGAEKRVRNTSKRLSLLGINTDVLCASKSRDTQTGQITATYLPEDIRGKNFIILDDICDGGSTFIKLAELLREQDAGCLYLYVTHGIFSKGLNALKSQFEHVYCYHTMLDESQLDQNFLTVVGE